MTCIRSGCNLKETHEVREGDFGVGFCDKHWEEEHSEEYQKEGRYFRERMKRLLME